MGGGTKRGSPESEGSSGSADKKDKEREGREGKRRRLVTWEPVRLGWVSSVGELEMATLAFQNSKLSERLAYRERTEAGLRKRMEQFQERQAQDDALLTVVNRHWNRLDSDVHQLLQRFDAETAVEDEGRAEDAAVSEFVAQLSQWDGEEADAKLRDRVQFSKRAVSKLVQTFDRLSQRNDRIAAALKAKDSASPPSDALQSDYVAENQRLRAINTRLQAENRELAMRHANYDDERASLETRMEEKEAAMEEAEFQLAKEIQRCEKLEGRLAECWKQLEAAKVSLASSEQRADGAAGEAGSLETVSKGRVAELETALIEAKELAASRLTQVQQLQETATQSQVALERAEMELRNPPQTLILDSTEYKTLQSHFSVLHSEATRIREHAEGLRNQLIQTKTAHLAQIEQLEAEELLAQKQLRQEMIQLEEQLSQVRREYEMLRLEFEQNLAANEQSAPVNREMRHLLQSCKTQIHQLKSEVSRYKKKWKDGISTIAKIQKDLEAEKRIRKTAVLVKAVEEEEEEDAATESVAVVKEDGEGKTEAASSVAQSEAKEAELRAELAALKRELKALRAAARAAGKTEEVLEKERERQMDEEALKRIRYLEEVNEKLKKEASESKGQEDTLLNEMESTGQAFEEMQDQNQRLLHQLREKDEANLKLMSERIRWNQEQKKLKEETELREEEVGALRNQVEAQNLVVRKLEEKEREMGSQMGSLEKEVGLRSAAVELNKRKALELAQSSADLRLQVEKLSSQLRDSTEAVASKTLALGDQSLKLARLAEEVAAARKEVERARRLEKAGAVDEVLMEEIREYKQQLTCSSCKVNKKDGLLTKCGHVFCMDCITKRYQLRKRKCPHCLLNFGANDFKRIYVF